MKITGTLKGWKLLDYSHNATKVVIWGRIYGDAKMRFMEGEVVRTSLIESIDAKTGLAKTMNSVYKLEGMGDDFDGCKTVADFVKRYNELNPTAADV